MDDHAAISRDDPVRLNSCQPALGMEEFIGDIACRIDGTWPVRTEGSGRILAKGTNALTSSVVLVCRRRPEESESIARKEFQRQLRREMPEALEAMIGGSEGASPIAPVDLAQAAIGPGMAIFSQYEAVLNQDGSCMTHSFSSTAPSPNTSAPSQAASTATPSSAQPGSSSTGGPRGRSARPMSWPAPRAPVLIWRTGIRRRQGAPAQVERVHHRLGPRPRRVHTCVGSSAPYDPPPERRRRIRRR